MVAVSKRGDELLLTRVADDSRLLAGLWEFPWVEGGRTLVAKSDLLAERYGGSWELGGRLGQLRHTITSRSIGLEVREAGFSVSTRSCVIAAELAAEGLEMSAPKPRPNAFRRVLMAHSS